MNSKTDILREFRLVDQGKYPLYDQYLLGEPFPLNEEPKHVEWLLF